MTLNRLGLTAVVVCAGLALSACASKKEDTSAASTGPKPGTQEDLAVNVGDRVFFDLDKYNISGEASATLQRQAAWLAKYPNLTVTLEGHCDERGTSEYNLALGDRRANAARDALVGLGVAASRIKTISYGKERPECVESSEACWAKNRRAVTVVTGGTSS